VMCAPDGVSHVTYDTNDLTWLNVLRFNPLVRMPEFLVGVCGASISPARDFRRWALRWSRRPDGPARGHSLQQRDSVSADPHGLLPLPFLAIIHALRFGLHGLRSSSGAPSGCWVR
jgi:hypothetical protein